jgi:Tetrapyrrole (Corrin/Porphyrin) Methylases
VSSRACDICIAGLGVQTVDHITLETEAAIRASREVLYVDTGAGTRAFLEARCPVVTSLYGESYAPGQQRLGAYRHMAARVLNAALDHPPVTFAMFGHPTVFAYASFLIADLARVLGLTVRVLPGISAMDCIFAEHMLDPAVSGLLVYEATDLLLRQRPLLPDVPTLIWQAGNAETRLHSQRPSTPRRFARLRDHLLRYYPPGQAVIACFAAPHALLLSTSVAFELHQLCEQAHELHAGVTLYLPPAAMRPIADPELLRQLDDPAHLASITR